MALHVVDLKNAPEKPGPLVQTAKTKLDFGIARSSERIRINILGLIV
jgi:hypothetical protein